MSSFVSVMWIENDNYARTTNQTKCIFSTVINVSSMCRLHRRFRVLQNWSVCSVAYKLVVPTE